MNTIQMIQKEYKSGLVLGKWMPLSVGHTYLISSAANGCDKLTVLACSIKSESIPGELRYKWVKSFCNSYKDKNIKVINMTEELPQLPEEHAQFWDIWCDVIKKSCPDIDVIYSSEDYGFELAKRLNIKHELVDKERITHPISGTKIRENPYKNWKFIYADARQYFINRIYFLGPESTGKTTISELLAKKFQVNYVPEYGRILCERKEGNIDLMDFYEIVIKQREIEDRLSHKTLEKLLFCDTEAITTKVFCDLYYPSESHKLTEFFDYHIKQQIANGKCYFFIMNPDGVEVVQDGTRNFISEEQRKNHFKKIIAELQYWNLPYTILTGNYHNRITTVEKYIKNTIQ